MFMVAAVQTFCARFTNAFLTSLNPLTYESGDWLADKEAEEEVAEPQGVGARVNRTWIPKSQLHDCGDGDLGMWVTLFGSSGTVINGAPPDHAAGVEEEHEVHEPQCLRCRGIRPDIDEDSGWCTSCLWAIVPPAAAATPVPSLTPTVGGEGPSGACDIPPSPPLGFQLPMFDAKDLEEIAGRYLVGHFPWPEDGLIGCTCGTKGFTISSWAAHVAELQVSETVFELQSLVYDQTQQK